MKPETHIYIFYALRLYGNWFEPRPDIDIFVKFKDGCEQTLSSHIDNDPRAPQPWHCHMFLRIINSLFKKTKTKTTTTTTTTTSTTHTHTKIKNKKPTKKKPTLSNHNVFRTWEEGFSRAFILIYCILLLMWKSLSVSRVWFCRQLEEEYIEYATKMEREASLSELSDSSTSLCPVCNKVDVVTSDDVSKNGPYVCADCGKVTCSACGVFDKSLTSNVRSLNTRTHKHTHTRFLHCLTCFCHWATRFCPHIITYLLPEQPFIKICLRHR